jgi:RHS repeat-associated protein
MDYAYTINGWIKGVNSNTLDASRDVGKDGNNTSTNLNKWFGRDGMGFSLGYFTNDYRAIDATQNNTASSWLASETNVAGNGYKTNCIDLYNGNISRMVTTIRDQNGTVLPQARVFRYDQLNRIKKAEVVEDVNVLTSNNWGASAVLTTKYKETFSYDLNGNLGKLSRYDGAGVLLDNLAYQYSYSNLQLQNNKLLYVDELAAVSANTEDIEDMNAGNYQYDAIGNLIADAKEEIGNIAWNNQGKITSLTRVTGSTKPDLEFLYDASGMRIGKIVKPRTGAVLQPEDKWTYTYYARDASGNVLATYDIKYQQVGGPSGWELRCDLKEEHVYGAARLGMKLDEQVASARAFTGSVSGNGLFDLSSISWSGGTVYPTVAKNSASRKLGKKVYELSNHLGNVLAVVSDRRVQVATAGNFVTVYGGEVMSFTDYYAFGGGMSGRSFVSSSYRYGFNGQEKDSELGEGVTTAEFWEYDGKLGRRWNVDPVVKEWESPYASFSNSPLRVVDPIGADGEEINDQGCGETPAPTSEMSFGTAIEIAPSSLNPWSWSVTNNSSISSQGRINFYISLPSNHSDYDLTLRSMYLRASYFASISGGTFYAIQAANASDAASQMRAILGENNLVGIVIFDGHGHFESQKSEVTIGSDKYNGSNIYSFACDENSRLCEIGALMDESSSAVFLHCFAGAPYFDGPTLLKGLSIAFNGATVYGAASMTFSGPGAFMGGYQLNGFPKENAYYLYENFTEVYRYAGTWYYASSNTSIGVMLNQSIGITSVGSITFHQPYTCIPRIHYRQKGLLGSMKEGSHANYQKKREAYLSSHH